MSRNHFSSRLGRTTLAVLAAVAVGACDESTTEPVATIVDVGPPSRVLASTWVADINLTKRTIRLTPPTTGASQSRVIGDYFGVDPQAELSLVGGDVIKVLPISASLNFAPVNVASNRRRVSFQLYIENKLSATALKVPQEFPAPPAGVTSPIIFAFRNVVTTTTGGVTGNQGQGNEVVVETPNEGTVISSDSIWQGPAHNFFNEFATCPGAGTGEVTGVADCFLYLPLVESGTGSDTIQGGAFSEPVRLGYDITSTVNNFRSNLIVAADLLDASPNALPTAVINPISAPCYNGIPLPLTQASTDPDGYIASYLWSVAPGGAGTFSPNASSPAVSFTRSGTGSGSVDLTLTVTDNRGGSDSETVTVACTDPPSDIAVTKSISAGSMTVGDTVTYRIIASEIAGGQAFNVVVTDAIPTNLTLVTGSITGGGTLAGGTITWNLGTTPGLGADTLTFRMAVTPAIAGNSVTNTATVASTNDSNGGNNSSTVNSTVAGQPNFLGRWVVVSSSMPGLTAGMSLPNGATVKPGDVLDFQLCVKNFDPSAVEIQTTWDPTRLNLPAAATDLNSAGSGVHTACQSGVDLLNEFFSAGPNTLSTNNKTAALNIAPGNGSRYTAGLSSYRFTVTGTAGQAITLTYFDPKIGTFALPAAPPFPSYSAGPVPAGDIIVNYHSLIIG